MNSTTIGGGGGGGSRNGGGGLGGPGYFWIVGTNKTSDIYTVEHLSSRKIIQTNIMKII
jgi:hypothetical protein